MKIFLSYARKDKKKAEALIKCLEKFGNEIWYDRKLKAGQDLVEIIDKEIKEADKVIVLFSQASMKSNWVRGETAAAFDASKLVPVKIDKKVRVPVPYTILLASDLSEWNFSCAASEISELKDALS